MKTKRCKALCAMLAALLCLAPALCACAQDGADVEELRAALEVLLPEAEKLNEIYYGAGMPTRPAGEGAAYLELAADAPYQDADALREATLAVFSEELGGQMFAVGVQGVYDEENEAFDLESRYTEILGMLVMRASHAAPTLELGRSYDLSTVKLLRSRKGYAELSIMSERNGEQLEVTLRLVPYTPPEAETTLAPADGETLSPATTAPESRPAETGWRLDSPTY